MLFRKEVQKIICFLNYCVSKTAKALNIFVHFEKLQKQKYFEISSVDAMNIILSILGVKASLARN